MASERTYGNTSQMENKLRRYNVTLPFNTADSRQAKQEWQDCITCNKNKTGKIPTNHACKRICGTTTKLLSTKVPKRFQYSKKEILRIQNTPNFMQEMTRKQTTTKL